MKHVRKLGAPQDYITWCNLVRGKSNENYSCLQNPQKANLHRALLREQGWLCAYTMRRIEESSSHIEHIKPEGICRAEAVGSDLNYANLVACFPREGMERKYRYGAQWKDNWWQNDGVEFVSPLHPNCETRFRFYLDGSIQAVRNHPAAVTTIRVLGLDHRSLAEDRKRVIVEFVYGPNGDNPMSPTQAQRAVRTICNPNASRFHEFCVVIRDALCEHVRQLRKLASRRRFGGRR